MNTAAPLKNTTQKPEQPLDSSESFTEQLLPFATVCLVTAALLFAELGKYPLFNPDEALYAEPAREMLENGDFITTYLNYVIRFTKPPLVIWAQAAGITVFGVNEFAVRFFEAACGLGLVAATFAFTRKFAGTRAAVAAAVSLMSAPLFIGTAREAITDMPLSLFMAGAMMCFFAGLGKSRGLLSFAWLLVGLSVMTKGPVGLVLPLGILIVYSVLCGRIKTFIKDHNAIVGLLIVSALSLPWFVAEIAITKGAYFHEFIMRENFQRFTTAIDSHGQPWWYHLAAMFGGFLPWSLFLPAAYFSVAPELWCRVKQQLDTVYAKVNCALKQYQAGSSSPATSANNQASPIQNRTTTCSTATELTLFCTLWSLGTLVFFSASVSKLLPYTMPAFPALGILVSLEFEKIVQTRNTKRALIPVALLALAFAGANSALPLALGKLRDAPPDLLMLIQSFISYELVFTLLTLALTARRFYRSAWFMFCIPTIAGLMFFGGKMLGSLSERWEGPLPSMARYAALSNETIFVYDMRKPSAPFYTRRVVIQPSTPDQLVAALQSKKRAQILTKTKTREFIESIPGCKVIRQEGSFILAAYRRPSS